MPTLSSNEHPDFCPTCNRLLSDPNGKSWCICHPADALPTFQPKCICPYCNSPAVSLQAGITKDAVVWWCEMGHVSAGIGINVKKNIFDFSKIEGEEG